MSKLKFSETHEWLRQETDGNVTIGITDYAQEQLGDVVYVGLPEIGSVLSVGGEATVLESVKTAGEIKTPISGKVIAVNLRLEDEPELINSDPVGEGWIIKIKPALPDELDQLMEEDDYQRFLGSLSVNP